MSAGDARPAGRIGPNGRPVRYYTPPPTVGGWLRLHRALLYRRAVQLLTLLLFFGTAHWGFKLLGEPVLQGNLSSSTLLGAVPLADPFATLQILLTGNGLNGEVLLGAAIVALAYLLLGGRVWCAWVCPVNPITDLAAWLRRLLGVRDVFHISRNIRYTALALALLLSALTGVAAFEWISPIGMLHRELLFGAGLGWTALLGILLFDLFIIRNGWCGHLCPLGAFYAVLGRAAPIRIRFDAPTCTHCGECVRVCPEPPVLNFARAAERGLITSGECSNCGRCIGVCPENTLSFDLRPLIARHNAASPPGTALPPSPTLERRAA
jgi:ferredoxin-type protein NapH